MAKGRRFYLIVKSVVPLKVLRLRHWGLMNVLVKYSLTLGAADCSTQEYTAGGHQLALYWKMTHFGGNYYTFF